MKYFMAGIITTTLLGMSFYMAQISRELVSIHKDMMTLTAHPARNV